MIMIIAIRIFKSSNLIYDSISSTNAFTLMYSPSPCTSTMKAVHDIVVQFVLVSSKVGQSFDF